MLSVSQQLTRMQSMVYHRKYPLLTLTFGSWLHEKLPSTFHGPGRFEVAMSNGLGDAFKRKYIFDLGIKVTLNIAQHPLQHVTYSPAKF